MSGCGGGNGAAAVFLAFLCETDFVACVGFVEVVAALALSAFSSI